MHEAGSQSPTASPRRGVRRLFAAKDGATAVEFAMVAVPFFALLFAIIETALIFFVGQMLDSSTAQVARQIRTGQAQQTGMSQARMAEEICAGMVNMSDCASNLRLDVRSYNNFNAAVLASPVNEDGEFEGLQFNIGTSSQIVVVRAFYTWPAFFRILPTQGSLANGDRLLASVAAFRNEPFPW